MSRARAITANVETIVGALTPETPLSAPRFRYAGSESQMQLRQFAVSPTGDLEWYDEYPQDQPGSLVRESFELTVAYPASHPDRRIRDVVREDVLAIQHALLDPANWDSDTLRSDQRTVSGYRVELDAENETLRGLDVVIPFTVRYRPF